MSSNIIVAILTGLSVAIPSIIATVSSNKKSTALTVYRLEQLEKKQDKHNSVIERTYQLEADVREMKEEVKLLKKGGII